MLQQYLQEKLQQLIYGNNPEFIRRDNLDAATDQDYMINSPQVVGYNSTAEQHYIFQNLIIGLDAERNTILDIGCGRGDLYGFIKDLYDGPILGYHGIDYNPIMVDLAKEKYGLEIQNELFESADFPMYDWIVASGFFTQRKSQSEDDDLRKMFIDIDKMYQFAQRAVTFNLLSPINNTIHEGFFYVHPGLVMDMLIEKYQNVIVRHNYSNDVYTVTIYKN